MLLRQALGSAFSVYVFMIMITRGNMPPFPSSIDCSLEGEGVGSSVYLFIKTAGSRLGAEAMAMSATDRCDALHLDGGSAQL